MKHTESDSTRETDGAVQTIDHACWVFVEKPKRSFFVETCSISDRLKSVHTVPHANSPKSKAATPPRGLELRCKLQCHSGFRFCIQSQPGESQSRTGDSTKSLSSPTKQATVRALRSSSAPIVPAVVIGDVFAPCNAFQLFHSQPELDDLFRTAAGEDSTLLKNKKRKSASLSSKKPTGLNENHVKNADPDKLSHAAASSHAAVKDGQGEGIPGQHVQHVLSHHSRAVLSDLGKQLMIRTMTPVSGRRLFFVSPTAANTIREALVIDRYNKLQEETSGSLALNGPASAVNAPGNATSDGTQKKLAGWWSDLTSWMQPNALASPTHSGSDQVTSHGGLHGASDGTRQHATDKSDLGNKKDIIKSELETMEQASLSAEVAAIRARDVGMPVDSTGNTASFVGRLPLEVALASSTAAPDLFGCVSTGMDSRLAAAAHGKRAFMDLRFATGDSWQIKVDESPAPAAGAATSASSTSTTTHSPSSSATSKQQSTSAGGPATTQFTSTSKPAGSSSAAAPKKPAGPSDEKLTSHERRVASETEDLDSDDDMAPPDGMTPIFQIPGVNLSLRMEGGQRVTMTPTFLSLDQLHAFLAASECLAKNVWLTKRRAGRSQGRAKLELMASMCAGMATPITGVTRSSTSTTATSEQSEDEDGMGELPEAKQLMAELGYGKSNRSSSGAGGLAVQPTGLMAVLNTMAIGCLSIAGQAVAAAGELVDQAILNSPWGLQVVGFPTKVGIKSGYLEPVLEQIAEHNSATSKAWHAKLQRRQLRLSCGVSLEAKSLSLPHSDVTSHLTPVSLDSVITPLDTSSVQQQQQHDQVKAASGTGSVGQQQPTVTATSGSASDKGLGQAAGTDVSVSGSLPTTTGPKPDGAVDKQGKTAAAKRNFKGKSKKSVLDGDAAAAAAAAIANADSSSQPETPSALQVTTSSQAACISLDAAGPQLESLAGVSVLTQLAWAMLHDARKGAGSLGATMAAGLAGQASMAMTNENQFSVHMKVKLKASLLEQSQAEGMGPMQPGSRSGTITGVAAASSPSHRQPTSASSSTTTQASSGDDNADVASSVGGAGSGGGHVTPGSRSSSAGLPGLPLPAGLLAPGSGSDDSHVFEIGVHVDLDQLVGDRAPDVNSVAEFVHSDGKMSKSALSGLLLMGDLGLSKHYHLSGSSHEGKDELYKPPHTGFMDLSELLNARNERVEVRGGGSSEW